jgi:hypothetical protein
VHNWEYIAFAIGVLAPFVTRAGRAIFVETFRHPAKTSVIVREANGNVHAELAERAEQDPAHAS